MKALLDTNILIDLLANRAPAFAELERYDAALISRISWIEIAAGFPPGASSWEGFLDQFDMVELDGGIARAAVDMRRRYRLKLPDAVIYASARERGALLVTRNTRDFPEGEPDVRFPYKV